MPEYLVITEGDKLVKVKRFRDRHFALLENPGNFKVTARTKRHAQAYGYEMIAKEKEKSGSTIVASSSTESIDSSTDKRVTTTTTTTKPRQLFNLDPSIVGE